MLRPALVVLALGLTACASSVGPPSDVGNACTIRQERQDWYAAAKTASKKWRAPMATILAIIWRESRFQADAQPPRTYALGIVPTGRQSSAYGFPQAIDGTWDWYRESARAHGADREDFADSADFIGWYMAQTRRQVGLPMGDAMGHYLAYHEGHEGFKSQRWKQIGWLTKAAREVARMADAYDSQLRKCDADYARMVALRHTPLPGTRPFALARVMGVWPGSKPVRRVPARMRTVEPRSRMIEVHGRDVSRNSAQSR